MSDNKAFKWRDVKVEPPKIGQANDDGQVIYWSRSIGLYFGNFQRPTFEDTTQWTYAPQPCGDKASREELLEAAFDKAESEEDWGKDGKLEPWQRILMKIAFLKGANSNL